MKLFILLLVVAIVYGEYQYSCIHNNHDKRTSEHVIHMVLTDMDHDDNGEITAIEVMGTFIVDFDRNPIDQRIDHDEFVKRWENHYRDVRHFATYLFLHLDTNNDHYITTADVSNILLDMDYDRDGTVYDREFTDWMHDLYTNCRIPR